jgi:hypothetical protein
MAMWVSHCDMTESFRNDLQLCLSVHVIVVN